MKATTFEAACKGPGAVLCQVMGAPIKESAKLIGEPLKGRAKQALRKALARCLDVSSGHAGGAHSARAEKRGCLTAQAFPATNPALAIVNMAWKIKAPTAQRSAEAGAPV